jgi:hypothetical protein
MYVGKANSPATTLTSGITDSQTTIAIASADILATLNSGQLITIGSGENAETVHYTGVDGTTLTGCTRGYGGTTASAWDSGTAVRRVWTAEDYRRLVANVENISDYITAQEGKIVGMEWDTSDPSPTLTRIDANGDEFSPTRDFFDNHPCYNRWRCVRDRATGKIQYGYNPRGDGLALDGSDGDVLVSCPAVYVKSEIEGDIRRFWISPTETNGFVLHPYWYSRAGEAQDVMYKGAYEGSLRVKDDGTLCIASVSGVQPWTGYYNNTLDGMFKLGFTAGDSEPSIGDTVTGVSSGSTGVIVDYYVSSGTWAGGDAAGELYLKQTSATFTDEESITFATVSTAGGNAGIALDIDDAEDYANNIDTGFGIQNFWGYTADQLLIYIEYGTLDLQSIAKGIVDKASGSGFAGEETGADSVDSNIRESGSGTGTGTNGHTPIVWRGIENIYGNTWEFLIGANFFNTDGSYRLVNRDGSGTYAGTLAAGSYESGSGVVPNSTNGYISGFLDGDLEEFAFLPSAAAGSSSTYVCDNWWYPRYNPSILLAGGDWSNGLDAGPGCRSASGAPSVSNRSIGARVEFAPGVVA